MNSELHRLKTSLMTDGIAVTSRARAVLRDTPGRPQPLTLNDYASTSGITLRLDGDVWVNAPLPEFNPNFVADPSHQLDHDGNGFVVVSGALEVAAIPIPVPSYHDRKNRWGEPFTSYAITHSDRVRISPVEGCAWACQFCDLPYDFRYRRKEVERLVDSVAQALADPVLPARHVLISGGTPRPEDYDYEREVYATVAASFPGVEVDVMMSPAPGLLDPQELLGMGIHGLSINLELFGDERSRRLMHAKWKLGRQNVLAFLEHAAEVFGPGRVRSLLMVGLEPVEDTLAGVAALAVRGCDPVLSPFRPDPSTPLRGYGPPTAELLMEVYERSAEIAELHGVQLGPRCSPCQHNTLTFPLAAGSCAPEYAICGAAAAVAA